MITVLFATHNGATTLPLMLEAMTHLESPDGGWQLVVVNNDSNDETSEVLEQFGDRLPLKILYEPRRGKNIALNTGLGEVKGDLVILTDDDVLPRQDWLLRWRETANERQEFAIFGGAIRPFWEKNPEDWIMDVVPLGPVFAVHDPVPEAGEVSPYKVWGGHMAVRSVVFDRLRFNENVGPNGSPIYRMGSETDFTVRAVSQGWRCYFEPRAVVEHIIHSYQVSPEWIMKRALRYGRNCADWTPAELASLSWFFGYPSYLIRQLVENYFCYQWARVQGNKKSAFLARWRVNITKGLLIEGKLIGNTVDQKNLY